MGSLGNKLRELQDYGDVADIGEIARRYFAMNAFDGILTIIGVLMGNLSARIDNASIVITTGLSTSVAMGISGLWGAYLTESAERKRGLDELGNHTLTDLSETRIGRASRFAVVIVALVDGLSPFLASVVVLLPMMFSMQFGGTIRAYYASLGLALATLFALGSYLGTVSRENLILSGIKMLVAGLFAIWLSYILGDVG
jgi:predicted membrane protein (TIGR00267 family)